jgi:hypothetical protein
MLRTLRKFDSDLYPGEHAQIEVRLDAGAADAQISEATIPHGERMRGYSNRNIDPDPLAPSVFHRLIMPPPREAPYRTSQATALRFLLHCAEGRRLRGGRPFCSGRPLRGCRRLRDHRPLRGERPFLGDRPLRGERPLRNGPTEPAPMLPKEQARNQLPIRIVA